MRISASLVLHSTFALCSGATLALAANGCSSSTTHASTEEMSGTDATGSDDMGGMHGKDGGTTSTSSSPTTVPIKAIDYDALFVVNGLGNSISVVNTTTNKVAGTIKLKNAIYPHHIYMSPDGSKLALAVPGMDMSGGHEGAMDHAMPGIVFLLDARTGATLKSRKLAAMNHNATFSPDGTEIWTSQMAPSGGTVAVLNATTLKDETSVAVGMGPAEVTFSADGKYVFVANGADSTVSVVDPSTKDVVKTIKVGETPVGAWQSPAGAAYVDNETAQTISKIDQASLSVKLTYNLGFKPGYVAVAPDGMIWITNADAGSVVIRMADMDMQHGEIKTGEGAHAIAFSGDGKTAYVTNQIANTLSVIDVATKKVTATVDVGDKPNGMVWRAAN